MTQIIYNESVKSPSSLAILAFTALACAKGGQTTKGCREDFADDCEILYALATEINTVAPSTPSQEICEIAGEFQHAVFEVFTGREWKVADDQHQDFFGDPEEDEMFSSIYDPGMRCVLYTGGDREQGFTCVLRSGSSGNVPNLSMSGYTGEGSVLSAGFCRDDKNMKCMRVNFLPSNFGDPSQPFFINAYVFGDEMQEPRQVRCPHSDLNYRQLERDARRAAGFVRRMVYP